MTAWRTTRKYHNQKVEIDGYTFDSLAEGEYYKRLRLRLQAGDILNLRIHPRYVLQEPFRHRGTRYPAIVYIADFDYIEPQTGDLCVDDVKGVRTESFNLKMKLLLCQYPDIRFHLIDANECRPPKKRGKR